MLSNTTFTSGLLHCYHHAVTWGSYNLLNEHYSRPNAEGAFLRVYLSYFKITTFKPCPDAFNISFNIVQHCCMQHVGRVWRTMLNVVERNSNMFKFSLNMRSTFILILPTVEYVECVGHPWLQHHSTSFNSVERCWTKCWKRLARALYFNPHNRWIHKC